MSGRVLEMRTNAEGGVRIIEDASVGPPDVEDVVRRYGIRPTSMAVYYDGSGIAKTELHFDPPARPFTPTIPGRFQPPIGPSLAEAMENFGSGVLNGLRTQLRNERMIRKAYEMGATVRSNAKPEQWTCGRCVLDWPDESPVCLMCGNTAVARHVPPQSIRIPALPPMGETRAVRVAIDGKVVGEVPVGSFLVLNEGPTHELSGVTIGHGYELEAEEVAPAPVYGFGVSPDGLTVDPAPFGALPAPLAKAKPETWAESYETMFRMLGNARALEAMGVPEPSRPYRHTFRVR